MNIPKMTDEQIESLPVWKRFVGLWPETRKDIAEAIIAARDAQVQAALAEQEPVGYQMLDNGVWRSCSYFVAFGWGNTMGENCRAIYAGPVAQQEPSTPAAQERAEPVAPAVGEARHIAKGADLEWQAKIFHEEMDKLGVPRDDGEDFYSLIGRANLATLSTTPPAPAQPACKVCNGWGFTDNPRRRCTHCGESGFEPAQPSPEPSKPEQAEAPKAGNAEPVARIEFRRGEAGRENEMPRVISCNWLPDGVYEVYLATLPPASAAGERESFEKSFQIPEGMVRWDGVDYKVHPDFINSYRADRYCGQWQAWKARAALATKPQAEQEATPPAQTVQDSAKEFADWLLKHYLHTFIDKRNMDMFLRAFTARTRGDEVGKSS